MKKAIFISIFAILIGCAATKNPANPNTQPSGGFCGRSSLDACKSDQDCAPQGCSGQICQSKKAEPSITTCEWKDCYRAETFGVQCGCVKGKCQWH